MWLIVAIAVLVYLVLRPSKAAADTGSDYSPAMDTVSVDAGQQIDYAPEWNLDFGDWGQGTTSLSKMEQAIATYEGYYKPGTLPARTNNPGDIGTYGGKVASYPDAESGWAALEKWITGHASAHPTWTFYDMIRYYLTGDTRGTPGPNQNPDAYAEYVAGQLNVDPSTPVSQVLGG